MTEQQPNEVQLHKVRRKGTAATPAKPAHLTIILCIVFALVAASCGSDSSGDAATGGGAEDFRTWATENAQPILSLDLDADMGDLAGFEAIVGDAQVVAVGETAHNISEQMETRTRLLSHLVKNLGFRLLAAETSMPHAERINDYVLGEEADIDALLRQSGTWELMASTEMRAAIEWMRQYNSTASEGDFVQFYGIDITTPMPALESLDGYLSEIDPTLADDLSEVFEALRMLLSQQGEETWRDLQLRYDGAPSEGLNVIGGGLADLVIQMQTSEQDFVAASSSQEFAQAVRWATTVLHGHENFAAQVTAGAPNSPERVLVGSQVRDPAMAENVLWVLDQNPEQRMVLWSNNLHIQRSDPDRVFRVGDGFEVAGTATVGSDLADALGSSYLVIHAALHSGEAPPYGQLPDAPGESLDGVLNQTGQELFYLDVRSIPEDRPGGEWIRSPQSMRAEVGELTLLPSANFDAVYFVSTGTPAQELGE